MPWFIIIKLPQFVITLARICNKKMLPQFVITLAPSCNKMKLPEFVITLAPIGNKNFPNLWYSFAPICNKVMSKLAFLAISEFYEQQQLNLTLLCYWWWNSSKLGHVTKFRLHFHFVKPYNRQTKRNGTFRDLVLGSCLLRKGAGTLHQIYIFVGGGR